MATKSKMTEAELTRLKEEPKELWRVRTWSASIDVERMMVTERTVGRIKARSASQFSYTALRSKLDQPGGEWWTTREGANAEIKRLVASKHKAALTNLDTANHNLKVATAALETCEARAEQLLAKAEAEWKKEKVDPSKI